MADYNFEGHIPILARFGKESYYTYPGIEFEVLYSPASLKLISFGFNTNTFLAKHKTTDLCSYEFLDTHKQCSYNFNNLFKIIKLGPRIGHIFNKQFGIHVEILVTQKLFKTLSNDKAEKKIAYGQFLGSNSRNLSLRFELSWNWESRLTKGIYFSYNYNIYKHSYVFSAQHYEMDQNMLSMGLKF